jgi:hypothetical protein
MNTILNFLIATVLFMILYTIADKIEKIETRITKLEKIGVIND